MRREREPRALRIAAVALLLAGGLGGCASPSMQAASSAPADEASLVCALPDQLHRIDRVDFRVDAPRQRIDYRSQSTFGLFDFARTGRG